MWPAPQRPLLTSRHYKPLQATSAYTETDELNCATGTVNVQLERIKTIAQKQYSQFNIMFVMKTKQKIITILYQLNLPK